MKEPVYLAYDMQRHDITFKNILLHVRNHAFIYTCLIIKKFKNFLFHVPNQATIYTCLIINRGVIPMDSNL